MAEKKLQHYVPRFYLRNFSSSLSKKHINVILLKHKRVIPHAALNNQCASDYTYGKDLAIENFFSDTVEGPASSTIDKIIRTNSISLTSRERASLLAHTFYQKIRTPSEAHSMTTMMGKMMDSLLMQDAPSLKSKVLQSDDFRNEVFRLNPAGMVENSSDMLMLLLDLEMKLLIPDQNCTKNKTFSELITSDNPTCLVNPYFESHARGGVTGWAQSGLQIFLPISPTHAIVFYDKAIYKFGKKDQSVVEIGVSDIDWLNSLVIKNSIECLFVKTLDPDAKHWARGVLDKAKSHNEAVVNKFTSDGGQLFHSYRKPVKHGFMAVCTVRKAYKGVDAKEKLKTGFRNEDMVRLMRDYDKVKQSGAFESFEDYLRYAHKSGRVFFKGEY